MMKKIPAIFLTLSFLVVTLFLGMQTADAADNYEMLRKRLEKMEGVWYSREYGDAITISGMALDGYEIEGVYELVGGDPGAATVSVYIEGESKILRIEWMSHTTEGMEPYFMIYGRKFYRL